MRLAVTIIGAALGVTILLLAAGLEPAMVARGERLAQRADRLDDPATLPADASAPADALLIESTEHHIADKRVTIVDVAATGDDAPVPPGLATIPGPGQVYVSPGMERTGPSAFGLVQQADVVGVVSELALADPNELVLWRGWDVNMFRSSIPEPVVVSAFPLDASQQAWWSSDLARRVGVAGAAMVLVVPVVVFIGVMLRLGALQRQRRLAALSLIGATPRQLRGFAVAEGLVVGLVAVAVAWPMFLAARHALARLVIGGYAWFPTDIQARPTVLVAIALAVPAIAAAAGYLSLRRVTASPLGVAARSRPATASGWRIVVAGVGMLMVVGAALLANQLGPTAVTTTLVGGAALIVLGLPAAAPWWVRQVARRATRHTSAPVLLAARRVDDDPAGAFRACSGIVLAVFGVTLVLSYVSGNLGEEHELTGSSAVDGVIETDGVTPSLASQLVEQLREATDSGTVTAVHRQLTIDGDPVLFVDCQEINASGIVALEPCPAGRWHSAGLQGSSRTSWQLADGTRLDVPADKSGTIVHGDSSLVRLGADDAFPATSLSPRVLAQTPIMSIVLSGDPESRDRAAAVAATLPGATLDTPQNQQHTVNLALLEAQRAVLLLCVIILAVGAASLVATLLGGMLASRSTIVHLRRVGLMARDLRRALLWQSLLPLGATLPFAVASGLATAAAFTHAVEGHFSPPLLPLAAMVLGSTTLAQVLIVMTYPAVERQTRPESANDE